MFFAGDRYETHTRKDPKSSEQKADRASKQEHMRATPTLNSLRDGQRRYKTRKKTDSILSTDAL